MRLIDLRDTSQPPHQAAAGSDDEGSFGEDRSYLVLASDVTYRFQLDGGNKLPWDRLSAELTARLPGNGHDYLHDVSVGMSDILIDARIPRDSVQWICREILARELLPPSAPVCLQHVDGHEERIGVLGKVVAAPVRTEGLALH